jgi:PLP dependent protein
MIAENLRLVKEEIAGKCAEIGRNPEEITLIAVSKNFGINDINEAFSAGQLQFGENKVQELQHKYEHFGNNINWHLIGTLQKNKVKYAVQFAEYIHSVDSIQLALEIGKRAEIMGKVQKILLQVKTSDEETKAGFSNEDEFFKTVEYCRDSKNLELTGLMTIAPFTDDVNLIRKSFSQLRVLKDDLNSKGFDIKELSMGMTDDFKIALEEGATMLRIGSAIFGKRDYSTSWKEI